MASKIYVRPPPQVALTAVGYKAAVLFLIIPCLLLHPLGVGLLCWVFVLCSVSWCPFYIYSLAIILLRTSNKIVLWLCVICVFSSRCCGLVCGLRLLHALAILTCMFSFIFLINVFCGALCRSRTVLVHFCRLMITYANSLDPDQDRQNVSTDLDLDPK